MQSHKRFIIVLSIASLISSLLIAGLAYMLVTSDDPFSITSRPLDGMKLCMIAGSAHCLLNLLIFYIYSPNSFESRPQVCIFFLSFIRKYQRQLCFKKKLSGEWWRNIVNFQMINLNYNQWLPYKLLFNPGVEVNGSALSSLIER